MTATYKPLSREDCRHILRALNRAAREIFPGLLAPMEQVARAASNFHQAAAFQLDDLPAEVIVAVERNRAHWRKHHPQSMRAAADNSLIAKQLLKHLRKQSENQTVFMASLEKHLWPELMHRRRTEESSIRTLWNRMIASRAESRLCLDLLLDLAAQFDNACDEPSKSFFVEGALFSSVWTWPETLPPSEAFAVRQVLDVALETGALELRMITTWAIRVGDFAIVDRAMNAEHLGTASRDPVHQIEIFARISSSLDGLLVYLHECLDDYLHALADNEDRYFARILNKRDSGDDERGRLPSLKELKHWSARLAAGKLPRRATVEKWGIGAIELYNHLNWDIFAPLRQLLPVLFYVEKDIFFSDLGSRLVEQIERWLCYWVCMGHRHGQREMNFNPAEVAAQRLVLEVVQCWHSESDGTSLLSRARELLNDEPARSWSLECPRPEQDSRLAFYLLPLWLLELRALRLYGRGSPEWHEANSLAEERFAFLACRVDLADHWNRDPRTLLLTLEAVRQLAVARCESGGTGQWDPEMRRCAQQILVRLETIDDARVRRALSAFFHPVLTSVAAWATAASDDPLEGLCLFEMARSRWLVDHLCLGDRTLQVKPNDAEKARKFKDRLFEALCAHLDAYALSERQNVPQILTEPLAGEFPNLARLAASNWLSPATVLSRIPRDAVVLAYELEHDPGDPPTILLRRAEEPWLAVHPGPGARLWMFLLHSGECHHRVCDLTAQRIEAKIAELQSANHRCLTKIDVQPAFQWRDQDVVAYESGLSELGNVLLAPWQHDGRFPPGELPLLIIPSGKLFELPWAAMPLGSVDRRLIDVARLGVMPGLGFALWSSSLPIEPAVVDAEVFLQAASTEVPAGLALPPQFVDCFRSFGASISEGPHATPSRALEAFQHRNVIIFMCHGEVEGTAYLQLHPQSSEGRLTMQHLDHLPPADHVTLVMLGCCWGGVEVRQAAEQIEGLTSALLLKGVRSVISGIGMIPINLIHQTADAVLTKSKTSRRNGDAARVLRNAQLLVRNGPTTSRTSHRRDRHPWDWASLTFHGVPWD